MLSFLREIDHQIFFAVHNLQKLNLDPLLAWPTYLGSLRFAVPVIFIFTLIQSREKILPRFLFAAAPVLIAHEIVEFLKYTFKVPRPFTVFAENPGAVNVIFEAPSNLSFPSGHASTAFATAVVLSTYLGVPRFLAFSLAVLICMTRMYVGVHFPSDLIAGALLGTFNTLLFFKLFKLKDPFNPAPVPK